MNKVRLWAGRLTAIGAVAAALILGFVVLVDLDRRPRTHDAYLFADTAGMAPDVSGRITQIYVRDNQLVHKGDTLVQIDPEPFELRIWQSRAQIASLRAQISTTARQVASQSSGADAAAMQVDRARAQLALARDTRGRLEPLLDKRYVTVQQVDEARTNERTAEVALDSAVAQAVQARKGITDTQSLIAQLDGAEATLRLAERDLRNSRVLAPFDGRVVGLEIAEGSYASAGHPLFTLIDDARWYAVADFRETELPSIHIGEAASIWPMADTRQALKGHVESIGWGVHPDDKGAPGLPAVERTLKWVTVAQRFPVRVLLDHPPPDALRIGATVSVVVRGSHGG